MKAFEIKFTKTILLASFFMTILAIVFCVFGTQKVNAVSSAINIPTDYVNIGFPHGMVMSDDGDIWYVDTLNTRLVKYDPDTNTIVRTVGRLGTNEGEFSSGIYNITQDDEGNLYILSTNGLVYKLDSNGGYLASYDLTVGGGLAYPNGLSSPRGITYDAYTNSILITNHDNDRVEKFTKDLEFVSGFGSHGSGNYQFDGPWGITTDSSGRIYVADEYDTNSRIMVYSSGYSYLFQIKNWVDENEVPRGFTGESAVKDVLILDDGTITVTAQNASRVVQFNSSGGYLRTWGFTGPDIRHMQGPEFMVKDSTNNIYVSDLGKNSILKYSNTGTYLDSLKKLDLESGKLYKPIDVAYDASGNMYVIDWGGAVVEFTSSGTYVDTIIDGSTHNIDDTYGLGDTYEHIAFHDGKLYTSNVNRVLEYSFDTDHWDNTRVIGSSGTGNGQFVQARGISFDTSGNLYVTDLGNKRIQKFDTYFVYDSQLAILSGHDPHEAVVDSSGNIYVADEESVFKYTSMSDDEPTIIGSGYSSPRSMTIDRTTSPNKLYVSDQWGSKVQVYNTAGDLLDSFGTTGGGQVQFAEPWGSAINPLDGTISVCDTANARVESFTEGYYRILNLIPSANVISLDSGDSNGESISDLPWPTSAFTDPEAIPARLMFGDYVVADFTVDLTQDRNWVDVNVQFVPSTSKALVVNLNQTDAPGISSEHSLYISRYSNQTSATVCPQAIKLFGNVSEAVVEGCTSGYVLTNGVDSDISPVTIDTKNYWEIDHLTGTGAYSSLFETGFELSDVMTRQQISTASNHEITFGTTNAMNHSGDTITLSFSTDWNLSTIDDLVGGDLSLYDWTGAKNLTLGATADTDIWGVVTDNSLKRIVFTAPTNADISSQSILADSVIKVFINNNSLINPSVVNSYEITMRILTNSEANNENGSVSIAIVDSDTVNINGYVLSNLFFDLDTGTGETPTWPAGGNGAVVDCEAGVTNLCLAYANGPTTENYTVDLGHLTMAYANKSNGASVIHSNGDDEIINSIYFDFSTNAASGGVITYKSLYGELRGPAHNIDASLDLDIPTTNGGEDIQAGTSGYGIQLAAEPVHKSVGTGTQTVNCSSSSTYCVMGDINPTTGVNEQVALPIYTVTGPIELGRGRIDVGAAIDGIVVPGGYEDQITFIATSIF